MTIGRRVYTALVWVAMPFAALYLLWRSRRQPEYRRHWGERFGWEDYPSLGSAAVIWVHAVSLGETRAAQPLIEALAQRFPQHRFLLTHMTPTGRFAGATLAERWPGRVMQTYLPYDMPFAVRRFLAHFRPVIGIGMETETWPNLLAAARDAGVPMVLVNARLSERSLRKSRRAPQLFEEAARCFTDVLAQTEADAARLREAGARRVEVVGNLKFDLDPDLALIDQGKRARRAAGDAPVLLFATTREGEEALLVPEIRKRQADLAARSVRVIVVPRHPQRFNEVAALFEAQGFIVARRSRLSDLRTWFAAAPGNGILLGDSMGEMPLYYAATDVAFIGGSLLPLGGHNLIEACAVGTPIVFGPHTFNFAQAADDAVAAGAAIRCSNAESTVTTMLQLVDDAARRRVMADAARAFAEQHRGATARTIERLVPIISGAA